MGQVLFHYALMAHGHRFDAGVCREKCICKKNNGNFQNHKVNYLPSMARNLSWAFPNEVPNEAI